ncbi:TonB family protein [Luteimonas sp. S4-F44]|uniref:energy transducer TonB n=1 Tax=Luteimonas sp. S4-F44 TaxID=2925842 RepID=UPI001F53B0EB|nr:energy transducer TonB [Luteimonas sp. S4-F44]UNK43883.1 TonB family protein [Luteimonas sp. S4-F44]
MSAPSPASRPRHAFRQWLPTRRAWLMIAAACALGGLLFAGLWWQQRDTRNPGGDIAISGPPDASDRAATPLPAPLPASVDGASGRFGPAEDAPQGAPAMIAPPVASGPEPAPATPPPETTAQAVDSTPRPLSTPQPRYPRASLRRGESGDVMLRVQVGADGRVAGIDVIAGSGHTRLDRAAVSAVRRWRFEPAMRAGQPVPGEVRVPIAFSPTDDS